MTITPRQIIARSILGLVAVGIWTLIALNTPPMFWAELTGVGVFAWAVYHA